MTNRTPLPPGFMVVHGNHPESLRDLMLSWMTRHPLAPLEDEWVLVQSNGVAQWLKLSLAAPVAQGGWGIAAALRTELPASFIWQAYRAVLGNGSVPAVSPFDKPMLVWRLMRLLPVLLAEEAFVPLRRFLAQDDDRRKLHQLAERLADLFDQYQVYRADWLADWAGGRDVIATSREGSQPLPDEMRWQPRLWRALLDDVGPHAAASSRADVHRRFLDQAHGWHGDGPAGLPRRLVVFGISSLPQQSLEVLATLARWMQVLMCVHNPCEHDWSHVVADKDLLRAQRLRQRRRPGGEGEIADEALHLHAQPLLAAWGKQGRDFIRLLDAHDEREAYAPRFAAIGGRVDCFERNPGATLLEQLQDDIRDLRPLAETRNTWPTLQLVADRSIRFHIAHGPQREVEVLHDQLLAAFAADPTLQPREVIVMVPDIAAYAPHVQAVFGQLQRDDARHIPFTLADRGQRHHDPLLGALEKLLGLPQCRLAVSDVLDLLEVPALRARFGIAEPQLPLLHRWVQAANARWGLHAEQRGRLGLPADLAQNTWDFGLQRMLLGYAVGSGEAWEGIEPMDEVGGLDAALLGPLSRLLGALEHHWRALDEPATPTAWGERLRALLQQFFLAGAGTDGFTLLRLDKALQDWQDACQAAALDEPLPLSVVREHWLTQIDAGSGVNQPFFAGAVTFATLMPMRAIPFRFVALLGMNDGDYPRSRPPTDFDLMAKDWRPGDRSRREDDRYLFLEALLSARERLHLSWVGRSIRDNQERPPSVLVSQLRDHLAAGWRQAGDDQPQAKAGAALLTALTVAHRLQPFNPAYFNQGGDERLFSYAREWRAVEAGRTQADGVGLATAAAHLPDGGEPGPLTLKLVSDFVKNPVRSFFQRRLGIRFETDDPVGADQEPFAIDALENWQLQDELIQVQKAALVAGGSRQAALDAQLDRIALRGELPAGEFGKLVQGELAEPMQAMFDAYAQALADWPLGCPDEPLDYLPEGFPEAQRLVDWLGGMRRSTGGERGRVLLDSGSLVKENKYRHDKLLPFWVAHLAGHLAGEPLTTVVVSKAGQVSFGPMDTLQARQRWQALLEAWQVGHRSPLPLALGCGFVWLGKGGHAGMSPHAADAFEAARVKYEDHEPKFNQFGERDGDAYLARAFPDFQALWAGGVFATWADALLRPLMDAMPHKKREAKGDASKALATGDAE